MNNYWGTYISNAAESASAKAEPSHAGWYRYRKLFAAESVNEVSKEIMAFGGVPLEVRLVKRKHPFFDRVSRDYKVEFLNSIKYNLGAGISAGKSFIAVADSENGEMRAKLEVGARVLQRGGGFADAMKSIDFFDGATLAILDAGEHTGTMRASIDAAIEHYGEWQKSMSTMMWAVVWLAIDFLGAVSSVAGNKYGFLPMMKEQGITTEDPAKKLHFAKALEYTGYANDFLLWVAVAFGICLVAGLSFYYADDPAPRKWIDKKIEKVPYLGQALQHFALSTTTKVLSALLAGGVHLLPAIAIATKGTRNEVVKGYWEKVSSNIEAGESIARAFQSGMLDGTESVSLGAHTNQKVLAEILGRISLRRFDKGRTAMKKFLWLAAVESIGYTVVSILITGYVWILQNSMMSG